MTAATPIVNRRLLLDVNVWVALMDSDHQDHQPALTLLTAPGIKIASCAITQSGAIRLGALPKLRQKPSATHAQVRSHLLSVLDRLDHEYWQCEPSPVNHPLIEWSRVTGHRQVTDVYLLALAVQHNATLASFDQRIALQSVRGASSEHYRVL